MNEITWRNDDVSFRTDFNQFKEVQELFNKYNVTHTIALICKDIDRNPALIEYINANNVDVQIHCWEHVDLTLDLEQTRSDLYNSAATIYANFYKLPQIVYPPWNISIPELEDLCEEFECSVSNKKISLSQYMKAFGDVKEDTINFHSWHEPDRFMLESALKIYDKRRKQLSEEDKLKCL